MFRILILAFTGTVAFADNPASVDSAAAAKIQALGGIVLPVAQNDPRLDVSLHLTSQPVTDETLVDVGKLGPVVLSLNLTGTKITDAGLEHLGSLKSLEKLHLAKTGITDAGLKSLAPLEDLVYLNLYGTKVTDAGLKHLAALKKLQQLYLWQTDVTQEGIEALQLALPDLMVVFQTDFVPVDPQLPPEAGGEPTPPPMDEPEPEPEAEKKAE